MLLSFLGNHSRAAAEIKNLKASNSGKGNLIETARAKTLGVSVDELNRIDRIADDAAKEFVKADKASDDHRNDATKNNKDLDLKVLRGIQADRYLTVIKAINSIQKTLSPTSWKNLRDHVNQQIRSSAFTVYLAPDGTK